jgi:hypothetical protein
MGPEGRFKDPKMTWQPWMAEAQARKQYENNTPQSDAFADVCGVLREAQCRKATDSDDLQML